MSIEEQLKDLIQSRYKSLRNFTTTHNLAYSSVASIFKRSLFSASFQLVSQICVALELDLNELALNKKIVLLEDTKDKSESINNFIDDNLSVDELRILQIIRNMDKTGQQALLQQIESNYAFYQNLKSEISKEECKKIVRLKE